MGTRSTIGILNDDGTVSSIYCHWDGYLSHNGKILTEYYQEESKVRELIGLGAISSLAPNVNPETKKHTFDTPDERVTVAYCRDRGEDLNISIDESEETFRIKNVEDIFQEYTYLFKSNNEGKKEWFVVYGDTVNFVPVVQELSVEQT